MLKKEDSSIWLISRVWEKIYGWIYLEYGKNELTGLVLRVFGFGKLVLVDMLVRGGCSVGLGRICVDVCNLVGFDSLLWT